MQSPAAYYQQQKEQYEVEAAHAAKSINRVALLRLATVAALIVVAIAAWRTGAHWQWWLAGALALGFMALVRWHGYLSGVRRMADFHLFIINGELEALKGNYSSFPDGGAYTDVAHAYSYDLDIFGKGSVYQMLCRSVTMGGAVLLAQRLSKPTLSKDYITTQQGIIAELAALPGLHQEYRIAGMGAKEAANDQERLTAWLSGPDSFINNTAVRIAAIAMPLLAAGALIYSIAQGSTYGGLPVIIVINMALLGAWQKKIKPAAQQIGNSAKLVDKYEHLLQELAGATFAGTWLKAVSASAKESVAEIGRFKKLVNLFDARSNGMIGPLMNALFLFDILCLLRLETWRKRHRALLLAAIDNVVAMDVYISCAVYAYNHPENVYPELNSGSGLKAEGLRHPLLPADVAVGNDVSLGRQEQFYLLTGANMTGKSTFIRTIGVSNVLTNMGLPLPATALSMPLLGLYTSIRVTDSVQDDISYFKAELNRIKDIMQQVKEAGHPCMVLLDEPLRGTNSTDKQQGTRAIVEQLLRCSATGIVATHDAVLCDMEQQYPGQVRNYHFESSVEDNTLSFDFKLKTGASTSNNATVLMRLMGIIK